MPPAPGNIETLSTPESSWIRGAIYVRNTSTVTLYFKKGGKWDYSGVPEATWRAFKTTPSKGRFTNLVLKR